MNEALAAGRHDIEVNGARLVYHVFGDGPVLIAFPGGPGFSHDYLRMPLLEQHAKIVYVDPIGCGDSEVLADPTQYGRARDVRDLEELRRHLGLERISLLGHSAGGFVAQQYAIEHPTHVERLVLVDTSPTNGAEFDASLENEMKARADKPWFPAAAGALKTFFNRIVTEEEARALVPHIWPLYAFDHERDATLSRTLAQSARLSLPRMQRAPRATFDFRPQLPQLRVPTLIIVGAGDFICAPQLARMMHEAIPGSKLVTMERSGHMPHVEEAEALTEVIASCLGEAHRSRARST
jgi:proline iminopeptidase